MFESQKVQGNLFTMLQIRIQHFYLLILLSVLTASALEAYLQDVLAAKELKLD